MRPRERPAVGRLSREHNDANVIAMGARLIGSDMAQACVIEFLIASSKAAATSAASSSFPTLLQESD